MGNLEKLLVVGVLVVVVAILFVSLFWTNDVPTLPDMKSDSGVSLVEGQQPPKIGDLGLPGESLAGMPKDPGANGAAEMASATSNDPNVGMTPLMTTATAPSASQPEAGGNDQFREYVIKPGDTLEMIAKRELGSKSKVSEITKANEGLDPRKLKVGRKILIPRDAAIPAATLSSAGTPATETAKPLTSAPSTGNATDTKKEALPSTDTVKEKITSYTVEKGDTLSKIAKKVYGDSNKWKKIFDANKDKMSNENALKVGMKLNIP